MYMFENDYALKAMSLFQSFVFSISLLFQYFSKLVGKLSSNCWKFFSGTGGGALYGNVGQDNLIEGDDVVHLYPDFGTKVSKK